MNQGFVHFGFTFLCFAVVGLSPRSSRGQQAADWTAVEDLRLGIEGSGISFWSIADVALGGGRVFVGDTRSREVYVFSVDGEPLDTLGRPGEGPGEFLRVSALGVIGERVVVTDTRQRRFTWYTLDGALLDTRKMPAISFDPPWTRGSVIPAVHGTGILTPGIATSLVADHPVRPQYLIDSAGVVLDTLPPDLVAERLLHVEYEGGAALSTSKPLYQGSRQGHSRNGRFWGYARSTSGGVAISLWDIASDTRHDHLLEIGAVPVPRAWADSVTDIYRTWIDSHGRVSATDVARALDLPDSVALQKLAVMDDGTVWINRPTFTGDREVWYLVDVVQESYETADLPRGIDPIVSTGDHVWGRVRDALGVNYVVRLELRPASKYGGAGDGG